jgi:hypothetical protein
VVQGLGEPEVEELGQQAAAALHHHHVGGLQIAVHDPAFVRGLHGIGDALEERHELLERHRPVLLDPRGQRDALDQLHRDPQQVLAFVDAEGVDVSGKRVLEPRCQLRLAKEPLLGEIVVLPQHFHDDVALEQRLRSAIDRTVPALPDLLEQSKLAQRPPGEIAIGHRLLAPRLWILGT